jgi:peroxiredoxin
MVADGSQTRVNREIGAMDGPKFLRVKGEFLLLLLLGLSVSLNVILSSTVRRLRGSTTSLGAPPTGILVKSIQVKDLEGHPMSISFTTSKLPSVIYVFRPACSWCAKNMLNLRTLVAAKSSEFRFLGISLQDQGVSEYVRTNELTMPIYTGPDAAAIKELRLNPTPQTVVIDVNGRVIKNWAGAYQGATEKEVESYFAVRLPGLVE